MRRRTKVIITKILLIFMLGIIGYFIIEPIYSWYRKKRNFQTEPNLGVLLVIASLFTWIPFCLILLVNRLVF